MPVDKRRVPRLKVRHLSFIHCGDQVMAVEIRNISEFGVCLVSDRPLPARGRLHLAWPGNSLQRDIEVLRCEAGSDGYSTGARFSAAGTADDLFGYIDYIRLRIAC